MPMTAFESATKFFEACETPLGWVGCKAYVAEGATFEETAAKAEASGVSDPVLIRTPEEWVPRIL